MTGLGLGTGLHLWRQSDYASKVRAIVGDENIVGYWPLWDKSGAVATEIVNGRHGTTTGATIGVPGIGDGRTAYSFDGVNDSVDVAGIAALSDPPAFNPNEGSVVVWGKMDVASDWEDDWRRLISIETDADNYISLHTHATNGSLQMVRKAGGAGKSVTYATGSPLTWFWGGLTWSDSGEALKAYYAGAQVGSTQTPLATWVGNLESIGIGARTFSDTPANFWPGGAAHVLLTNNILSAAQIKALYLAGART